MASRRSGTAMPTWSMVVSRPSGMPGASSAVMAASCPGRARRTRAGVLSWCSAADEGGFATGGLMPRSVIVSGARTPMGRLLGSLKDFSAADLGGVAIKAALERAGISGDQVDYVIMGQVIQAGAGQNPARPAAVAGGIPMSVPSFTLNKVCLSGLDAIALADQLIRAGEFDVVVAGGMESMTQAPHLLANSRVGTKYGDTKLVDAMAHDGLSDTFDQIAMGALTEQANANYGLTRDEQDAFAAASHQRAASAQKNGLFDDEITPVQ